MKKWVGILGLLLLSISCLSQNADEWLHQKRTQIKYLRKQIAALQVFLEVAKKGYDIAQEGLAIIGNIKDGDFKMHRDFIGALSLVNPRIKNLQKVADIIAMQLSIVKNARATISQLSEGGRFTAQEVEYCRNVFNRVLEESLRNLEQLAHVITNGELEMKDDERLKEIERIYAAMQEDYIFSASFSEQSMLLAMQRKGEQIDIDRSKTLNGLP